MPRRPLRMLSTHEGMRRRRDPGIIDLRASQSLRLRCADPGDVILKVTATAICGSDLHLYLNALPGMKAGDLLGHEVREGVAVCSVMLRSGLCHRDCIPVSPVDGGRLVGARPATAAPQWS